MSSSAYGFLSNETLPSEDTIVATCKQVGFAVSGTKLLDKSSQRPIAWVKYGPNVTIAEAQTQDWTAQALNKLPNSGLFVPRVFHAFTKQFPSSTVGFIVMEYVDASDCGASDISAVAEAITVLISLSKRDASLGHVGGDYIVHSLFNGWEPVADYKSVKDMNNHFNNLLKQMGDHRRVDLVADAKNGLFLCPSDVSMANFKKAQDSRIVVFDFRATCFMPRSLIGVAILKAQDPVARLALRKVDFPISDEMRAMVAISDYLPQFGQQKVAFPPGLNAKAKA